jgi:stearoyl-CoA desaturase (delta-9 desaturase)
MHNKLVRTIQILNHFALVIGLYLIFADYAEINYLFYSVLIYWFIGVFGINIGYHRLISHRSFETRKWIEYTLAFIGMITMIGSPLAWTALHRQHHGHAETDKDPHSPHRLGWWRAWFGFWNIDVINPKYIKDIRKINFYKLTHKYYFLVNALYVIALGLIDPLLIIFAYAIPTVLVLHSTSAIIVIAHIHGYRNHNVSDESKNSWIASLITLGEGWHNNHHANSKAWNNQENWWEFDPPAWIIRLIKT